MKYLSVKQKLMIWIALLMLLLVTFVLGILMLMSSSVLVEYAQNQMEIILRNKLPNIYKQNGNLVFSDNFLFLENGVYTIVYNKNGALLAGQMPLSFPDGVAFENGIVRTIEDYYVLDFRVQFGWNDSVWVRGVTPVIDTGDIIDNLLLIALFLFPLIIVISGTAAYLISRSTFRQIDHIISAAEAIEDGKDLSHRIGLLPGNDEISRMGSAFDRMFSRLEQSFETEKQFTSDVSHELRTPIAVILAQCEDIKRHSLTNKEYEEAFGVVERQAKRMFTMVGQLLQMTRLEQGTQQIVLEEADITELVEIICNEQPKSEKNILIETDLQPNIKAWFDVVLISRLLQNLLNNAVRYGKTNGHIWVTLRQKENDVILTVKDDGIGIPSDKLNKIWERFYQVDNARSADSGAGLGLTMVRQITLLHFGKVTVDSTEGAGSCFMVRFPIDKEKNNK